MRLQKRGETDLKRKIRMDVTEKTKRKEKKKVKIIRDKAVSLPLYKIQQSVTRDRLFHANSGIEKISVFQGSTIVRQRLQRKSSQHLEVVGAEFRASELDEPADIGDRVGFVEAVHQARSIRKADLNVGGRLGGIHGHRGLGLLLGSLLVDVGHGGVWGRSRSGEDSWGRTRTEKDTGNRTVKKRS